MARLAISPEPSALVERKRQGVERNHADDHQHSDNSPGKVEELLVALRFEKHMSVVYSIL